MKEGYHDSDKKLKPEKRNIILLTIRFKWFKLI